MPEPNIDFERIRPLNGGQREAFEEFCGQIAFRVANPPEGSNFRRLRGAGGDGGVECYWRLPGGSEWGWQAKFLFDLDKQQIENSVTTALRVHPFLTRYVMCLPFDLTGPKLGQGGNVINSETARFETWIQEWTALAQSRGMQVSFELWSHTVLSDHLLVIDASGGRRRFWFDAEFLSDQWFERQVRDAARAAEPRYSPQLSVAVPLAGALEAFGRTERWRTDAHEVASKIKDVADSWRSDFDGRPNELVGVDFPEHAKAQAEELHSQLLELAQHLEAAAVGSSIPIETPLLAEAMDNTSVCLEAVTEAFAAKHGIENLDRVPWRQWMTEYEVSFPTKHVDDARKIEEVLREADEWSSGADGVLSSATAMLVTGVAGSGKTHAICDHALDRQARGLRSIVLFGSHLVARIRGLRFESSSGYLAA